MTKRKLSMLVVVLVAAAAGPARARDRVAVIMTAGADVALADNLCEVAISTLAESGELELVGTRELRGRLIEGLAGESLDGCFATPDCRRRLVLAVGAKRAVLGEVRSSDAGLSVRLTLANAETGAVEVERPFTAPAALGPLIQSVQVGVAALFHRFDVPPEVAPVVAAPPAPPGGHRAGPALNLTLAPAPARERARQIVPFVAIGAGSLATVALSAAAVTGTMARATPTGISRAEAQRDLEQRKDYATSTNRLLLLGGTAALVAAGVLVWSWIYESPSRHP